MNTFKDFNGNQIELIKTEIFQTERLVYLALETKLFGSYLLRTLDEGEYVSHYPGRIYRFNSANKNDKPLLLLERSEKFENLTEKAAHYKKAIEDSIKNPRSKLFPIRRRNYE